MADKSFGVKELNLLNASGTPTVTSPNNLNLNANTVAISTSCTIGNNLTVTSTTTSANLNISGIATVVNFNATGISTIAQPADSNPMANWTITNNSASAYRFTGPGQSGTEDNPNIYLVRGHRYIFRHNATSSHPIQIRFANAGSAYTDGITYSEGNNTTTDGNNLIFNVQHDAPAQLFYQCTSHGGMVGNIYIVGGPQVISGVVTATTFVGNLTGNVTGTASANAVLTGSTNNQLVTVTGANAITGESNLTFDGTTLGLTGNQTVSGTVQVAGNSNFGAAAASPSPSALTVKMATNKHIGFSPTQSEVGDVPALVAFQDNGSLNSIGFRGTDLRFAAGSAERLRITDGGNLMLRSTAVNYLVMGSSGDSGFGASISNNMNWIRGNQANLQMNTATGGFMGFEIGGSEKFRIANSGQFGIGGSNYGTAGQVITSQGASSAPQWASPVVAGSILQTVYGTTTNEIVVTSTSFQNFTALNTSITRMSSNSHLWVWINAVRLLVQADSNEARVRITDGTSATTPYRLVNYDSDGNYLSFNPCLNWYWAKSHTAGTTVTITPQIRTINGNNVVWGDNGDTSMMIIQEIAR